jgi:hypothetical protein
MSYTFTNQVSATVEYNTSYAINNSWVKVLNNAGSGGSSKPLYAQASFITNLGDLDISLGAATVNIGSVELSDPDTGDRANVITTGAGQSGLVTYVANKNAQNWGFLNVTASSGSWTRLTSQAANYIMIHNDTGSTLDLSRDSSGTASFPMPEYSSIEFDISSNCNELYVRNNSGTTKTIRIIYWLYN